MEAANKPVITVTTTVNMPVEKVWEDWTNPKHIMQWCQASADWYAPHAENDLRNEGTFKTTMAAKDGSAGFDFEGVYTKVQEYETIQYIINDGRTVTIVFTPQGNATAITETFEAEASHPLEVQQQGWQAILDNFKRYAENTPAT